MKPFLFLFFTLLCVTIVNTAFAQNESNYTSKGEKVYFAAEVMPSYKGGYTAMKKFIQDHLAFPAEAQKEMVEGRIIIGFVVRRDGTLDNIKILNGLGFGCDEAAIAVVSKMFEWTPGSHQGKKINILMSIPIMFAYKK